MSKPPNNKGLRRLYNATLFSLQGFKSCFRTEEAFRQEVFLSLIFIPLGLYLGDGAAEKALLAGSVLLLMLVEVLNSAIERVVDRISSERHPLSGDAKDMGSLAVLIAITILVMTWGLVLIF